MTQDSLDRSEDGEGLEEQKLCSAVPNLILNIFHQELLQDGQWNNVEQEVKGK